ncbi:MAG TPA: ATP-binding protein [Candidatus Eisenbacteria bacterium]|nr:ATP-binding protein [Candidatus Eisenbacteria bacterium]
MEGESAAVETARALKLVARREHELLALSELSQELAISLDLYGIADLVLFNLMGQLGTSRAALWLFSDENRRTPVLVRSHGISKKIASGLGIAVAPSLLERFTAEKRLALATDLGGQSASSTSWLVRQASIVLFAPIVSRDETLGFLGVGPRVGDAGYGPAELQVLQTSLGMVGVALQNTKLYNRLLENNRQLRLANEKLTEADRLKSEFLQNVSHELRTPLTVVIASLQCLADQEPVESPARQFLDVAHQESQHLKGLLENLLDFSAAAKDQLRLQFETGDIWTVMKSYYDERLPGVTHGLREFTFRIDPPMPRCRFDRQRVIQVIDALVENAVKFTRPGAQIGIRLLAGEEEGRRGVRIEVVDDGPGIPADRLSTLFHPFRQLDGSTTREVGGMGIGLALAKQLAEQMEGVLRVTSEIGAGSTFTLFLPEA